MEKKKREKKKIAILEKEKIGGNVLWEDGGKSLDQMRGFCSCPLTVFQHSPTLYQIHAAKIESYMGTVNKKNYDS